MDHHFQGVADAARIGTERVVDVVEGEVMRDDGARVDLARAHERERPTGVHPALAARGVDADVTAHGQVHVHLNRSAIPGDHADPAAALDALEGFLHRRRPTGALQHRIGALAPGDLAHALHELLPMNVDDEVGPEAEADLKSFVPGAAQDYAFRAEGLAELHSHEADGAGPLDEEGLPGDIASHEI